MFEYFPIEILIKERQSEYYAVLSQCDREGKSTAFIEFMLDIIDASLGEMLDLQRKKPSQEDRIMLYREYMGRDDFSRKDYMTYFKDISAPTASRDLKKAVDLGLVKGEGDKRNARYRFV